MGRGKDRNEPSFKRSESFKRISIRKSYLDRGKRRNRRQKNLEPTVTAPQQPVANDKIVHRQVNEQEFKKSQECSLSRDSITYDEWLQEVSSSSREKLNEDHFESLQKHKIKITKISKLSTEADLIADDLKILELDASPTLTSKSTVDYATDEINNTQEDISLWPQDSSTEGPPSVSINLGRIWRDAVPVRVSVPVPVSSVCLSTSDSSVHHSLDSALKEKKSQLTVTRTVSAPEKPVSKDTSSSFGFSLKLARFANFKSG